MHGLLAVLCMCIIQRVYLIDIEPITTYSGTSICKQTVVLGVALFSGIVDFSLASRPGRKISKFSCSFRIETVPGSRIAVRFLPTSNMHVYGHNNYLGCRTQIIISSREVNIKQCNSFPQTELSDHEYVNIRYDIQGIQGHGPAFRNKTQFKMLLFTYSVSNHNEKCQGNETLCVGSRRCIYGPLKCSSLYDFCNNNFKFENCQNYTHGETPRGRPASFNGVFIFLSCLVFLVGVTIYMCFCQGVHLFECVCHCCSTLENTRSRRFRQNQQQNDLTQTGNGNEIDENVIVTTVTNLSDNEGENDYSSLDDTINSVDFGLPPSYSYIERNTPEQNLSDNDTDACSEPEQSAPCFSKSPTDLPPSYSTVLGHEEEYNVHII